MNFAVSAPGARFAPSPEVRAGVVDGLLVVLDLRGEEYSIFDEVATAMWQALVDLGDRDRVLDRLRATFDAQPARLEHDLDAFLARMEQGGFANYGISEHAVASTIEPAGTRRAHAGGILEFRAWRHLASTVLRLHHDGFSRTYVRAALAAPSGPARTDPALLERGLRAFSRAENAFLIRSAPRDCLPRSLALFSFLRAIGVPAEHRIGVTRFPFRAHAWTECGGRVLLDHAGLVARFTPIARLPR